MYPIVTVPDEAGDILEQLGTKPKFWFIDEHSDTYLFKQNRSEGKDATGEDWSEKVVSEICSLLDIPHAQYEFAMWKGRYGVVSRSFVPPGGTWIAGNEVLVQIDKEYPKDRFYSVRQHTLRLVLNIVKLDFILPPINWLGFSDVQSALDVFIGYLMLDAWVGGQDRHHENWGFIVSPEPKRESPGSAYDTRQIHLAPSFDHASSLGWNESDDTRIERLTTRDRRRNMDRYVERALSAFFSSSTSAKPMTTLDVFREAAKIRPQAGRAWLERLSQISDNDVKVIFDQIPISRISDTARDFAMKMLDLNQERLLKLEV
jgi:hypothetical protein